MAEEPVYNRKLTELSAKPLPKNSYSVSESRDEDGKRLIYLTFLP